MAKRRIRIDMKELEGAFELSCDSCHYYLDTETGNVLMVSEDASNTIETFFEESEIKDQDVKTEFEKWLAESDLHNWQQQAAREALQVELGYGSRVISVPDQDSHEDYRDMERFVGTVPEGHLRDMLLLALDGRGAFRRFKDVLYRYPEDQKRWYAFKAERLHRQMMDWLEEKGIELID